MRQLALVLVVVAACSKGNDRKQVCKVALETLTSGLETELKLQKQPEIKAKLEDMIKRAQDKFPAFCESASEQDLDCLARGTDAFNDTKCKFAVDAVKKIFLE
jgi:hypothetical protein